MCVCALFQDMNSAVITPCSHFFHAGCLKKWLYVQETCPLCHSQLKSQSPTTTVPNQDAPVANQSPAEQDEANKKQKDGTLPDDGKEGGTREQEEHRGPHMSAGETSSSSSSGVPSAPHNLKTSSSSSSSSPSPPVTESKNQLPTDHPSPSCSDTSDMPPSNSHHSSLQAEPEPAPQLKPGFRLGSQESSSSSTSSSSSSSSSSSRPDQPTSPSDEQCPPSCSL